MDIFHTIFYQPIFNLLYQLYNLTGNLGIAIIIISILVKVILTPVLQKQREVAVAQQGNAKAMKELREKYKDDPTTLMKEQLKLQKGSLAGLAGCLTLILTIILFINIRGVILDLTNQGWHAVNQIAYVEVSQKEQKFGYDVSTLVDGENSMRVILKYNDEEYISDLKFWIYDTEAQKSEMHEKSKALLTKNTSTFGQLYSSYGVIKLINPSHTKNISIYFPEFKDNFVVSKSSFLPGVKTVYFRTSDKVNNLDVAVAINGNTSQVSNVNFGDPVNLNFFGIDLSKTAIEVAPNNDLLANLTDKSVLPYLMLAILMGIAQTIGAKFMMAPATTVNENAKKEIEGEIIEDIIEEKKTKDAKKKKDLAAKIEKEVKNEDNMVDELAKTMTEMNSSMLWVFGVMSAITSLGLLGGANFFPSGLTVYWITQSLFDIVYYKAIVPIIKKNKSEVNIK